MEARGGLSNILASRELKWIFVGGKGGVGKTTTSAALGLLLAKNRSSVLIISTDPAHNLSDAFDQKLSSTPTLINGTANLFAMEVQPEMKSFALAEGLSGTDEATQSLLTEMCTSIPGIDECVSFGELMSSVSSMTYATIIFDTAPTGHTLNLLKFPDILNKGISRLISLKQNFGGLFNQLAGLAGQSDGEALYTSAFRKMELLIKVCQEVSTLFKDPTRTTFVAVCIPEFLAMYETERLVTALTKCQIDISNIVINQVLPEESDCDMCRSRRGMQDKYLTQLTELYDDLSICMTPLLKNEVRGVTALEAFSEYLVR
mmetsp:Transcript_34667/g.60957  ORF Transcript_34667/g.60957 Transcript_34667/m.60957 type:complete len:317 (-) Transcript_34667:31-981(-)